MPTLKETRLVEASVPAGATFLDAARELSRHEVAALAVLDERRHVIGLFTGDDLLTGLFPAYLPELRHTAFLREEADALAARFEKAGSEPVTEHMSDPETVDVDASAAHVAERFLHSDAAAIAVVHEKQFVGMVGEIEFCRQVLRRLIE